MVITITATLIVNSVEESNILRQLVEDILTDCSIPHVLPYIPTWNLEVTRFQHDVSKHGK